MFSVICAWINDWANNREAADLRRHRAHYDVTVMCDRTTAPLTKKPFALHTHISYFLSEIHWGRVTHICVNKLTIIGSDNGSVPTIWNNAEILLISPVGLTSVKYKFKFIYMYFHSRKCIWKCLLNVSKVVSQWVPRDFTTSYRPLLMASLWQQKIVQNCRLPEKL